MNEYCFPSTTSTAISTKKIKQFFSDFGFLCSFFILFFPLLLKILPFFSSYFISAFLLLLLLVALVSGYFTGISLSSRMENLWPRFEGLDAESHDLELECLEKNVVEFSFEVEAGSCGMDKMDRLGEKNQVLVNLGSDAPGKLQENPDEEDRRSDEEVNDKAMELRSSSINGANHIRPSPTLLDTNYENSHASEHQSQQPMISRTLSDLGSMRKEKEWGRTLACKLFQERHSVGGGGGGGGEGMDMLWEVYETTEEESRVKEIEISTEKEEKSKISKSRIVDYLEELDEDEEEEVNLCCLKALKLSAGKMHFGISKPGFLKFSKSLKGIKFGLNHHPHRKKKF